MEWESDLHAMADDLGELDQPPDLQAMQAQLQAMTDELAAQHSELTDLRETEEYLLFAQRCYRQFFKAQVSVLAAALVGQPDALNSLTALYDTLGRLLDGAG